MYVVASSRTEILKLISSFNKYVIGLGRIEHLYHYSLAKISHNPHTQLEQSSREVQAQIYQLGDAPTLVASLEAAAPIVLDQ